jgi:predicted enzyme related to lactoylglutathione lyase
MTSRLSHTSVDAHDPYAQSVFWAQVLGYAGDPDDPDEPGDTECLILSPDGRTKILFIEVPEGKTVKNRLHFDLAPTDLNRDDEVARLLRLGATVVADRRVAEGKGWFTLADPEGNEFCVLRGDLERPDPWAHLIRDRRATEPR